MHSYKEHFATSVAPRVVVAVDERITRPLKARAKLMLEGMPRVATQMPQPQLAPAAPAAEILMPEQQWEALGEAAQPFPDMQYTQSLLNKHPVQSVRPRPSPPDPPQKRK